MKFKVLSIFFTFIIGIASVQAQTQTQTHQHIFMIRYGTGNYKILDGATTGSTEYKNTSVFHKTCLWVAEDKDNVPSGHTGDSIAHVRFLDQSGVPGSNYLSLQDAHTVGHIVDAQPANKLYFDKYRIHAYNSGGLYHNLAYPGGIGSLGWRYWHTTALFELTGYTSVVCPVTLVEGFTRGPLINDEIGLAEFNTLTSSTYMRSQAALYHQYYQGTGHTTNGRFYTDHPYTFYAQEGKAITETKPADYTNFTYRWDLYDGSTLLDDYDPDPEESNNQHVSINHATGEVTYLTPYASDKTLTLRLTAIWQGNSTKQATDERTIVFHPLNNPTGLTAKDMQLQTHETKEGDYTLTGTDPVYSNVSATLASGDSDIIAINNDNYTFTVTGLRMGTVTVTITAKRVGLSDLTKTITVTVIDIADNHPTGIEDRIAYLNDLEDHSWSYYTTESPEGLRSLNPADVRITYYGNGNKNMTKTGDNGDENAPTTFSLNATGVKVGVDADVNTFVYYKTLERTNPAAGTGRCEYTTIPNPFSVRPVGGNIGSSITETRTFQVGNFEGTVNDYMPFSVHTPYSLSFQIYTYEELDGKGNIYDIYYYMYDDCDRTETIDVYMKLVDQTYFSSNSWAANYVTSSDMVFTGSKTFVKGWNQIHLTTPFNYTYEDAKPKNLLICVHDRTAVYYPLQQYDFAQYASAGNSTIYWYAGAFQGDKDPTLSGSGTTTTYKSLLGITKDVTVPADASPYRGFYKWRIASVSGGKIYTAATGGSPLAANAVVDAEQQLFFAPDNEYGMDVKFEALWAKAYVTTGTSTMSSGQYVPSSVPNAYERNFHIITGTSQVIAADLEKSYPCTITSFYPNGTTNGTTPASLSDLPTTYLYNKYYTESADAKFEYIRLLSTNPYSAKNGHNLILGRGITLFSTNTFNVDLVAGHVAQPTSDAAVLSNINNRIRVESGIYNCLYAVGKNIAASTSNTYTLTFGGDNKVTVILGCDYDRAAKDDTKLTFIDGNNTQKVVAGGYQGSSHKLSWNNNSYGKESIAWIVKSGTIKSDVADGSEYKTLYLGGYNANIIDKGNRSLLVEGGSIANIAGGMDDTSLSGITGNRVTIRIKGGTVKGCVYGAATYVAAKGDRKFVITGGTINGWIAGGCNGTHKDKGELNGSTFIYVGGNARVVQTGPDPFNNPVESTDPTVGEIYIGTKHVLNTTDGTGAYGGNIFGAGCGFQPNAYSTSADPTTTVYGDPDITVGKVFGTTIVVADSAVVGRDVYGGGKFGFVADATSGNTGLTGNTDMTSRIYILGGTVHGDVMGGARNQIGQAAEIYIRGGQLVGRKQDNPTNRDLEYYGDVYGGCDSWGDMNGTATIEMTGGTVTNIFGGGYGLASNMTQDVTITISGGLVKGNVYGGGECGMTGKSGANPVTTVNIRGGEIRGNVFGGALGTANTVHVKGPKYVNIGMGATGRVDKENCYIGGNVYGGSQRADDYYTYIASGHPSTGGQTNISSWVNVASGYIENHVFGAGFFGHTYGSTKVFIGQNAINNAPDHVTRPDGYLYDAPNTLIIKGDVFGGADFGSFDGKNFGEPTIEGYNDVYIDGKDYDTESQNPNADDYMIISGSVYGCGTSCYASKLVSGTSVFIRNYGHDVLNPDFDPASIEQPRFLPPTRDLQSIQFSDKLIIDKTHVHLVGQGKINSLVTSEKYSVYEMEDSICLVNGSTLCIDYPIDQIMKLGSNACADTYAGSPTYTTIAYNGLGEAGGDTDNKIGIQNGTSVYVHHDKLISGTTPGYGELKGFFHLMGTDGNLGTAHARPKQSKDPGNKIPNEYSNNLDGGFVSYYSSFDATSEYKNRFTAGSLTSSSTDPGLAPGLADSEANAVQLAYTNHTNNMSKAGETYFRVWEYRKGIHSFRDGTLDAHSNGNTGTYCVAEVDIILPDFVSGGSYRIKTNGDGSIAINYGEDVIPVNAAYTVDPGKYVSIPSASNWMYYGSGFQHEKAIGEEHVAAGLTDLNTNPDVKFGLVMKPNGAFGTSVDPVIIHPEANTALAGLTWSKAEGQESRLPVLHFYLTYSNDLKTNAVLNPVTITFEQVVGSNVVDEVDVNLEVVTSTNINQRMETHAYAIMKGKGTDKDTYRSSITFPVYSTQVGGEYSTWKLSSVTWTPKSGFSSSTWTTKNGYSGDAQFGMTCQAAYNADNVNGWEDTDMAEHDSKGPYNVVIGESYGRRPASIEFDLHYDGSLTSTNADMGTLTFTFEVTNCAGGTGASYTKNVIVDVIVKRVSTGKGWYVDGVHGNNNFSGEYPNAAKKTLRAILSNPAYQPGDDIYIVNEISTGSSPIEWNGHSYGGVTAYRYPGGKALMTDGTAANSYTGYDATYHDSPSNPVPYKGTLVKVTSDMTMRDITLDGNYFNDSNPATPEIEAEAPLVEIVSGSLTLEDATLQHNNNTKGNGGGVVVNDGATLDMSDSYIKNNLVGEDYNGGGIYMTPTATLNVNKVVVVEDNKSGTANNNVYLPLYRSWINVSESPADGMHIGVTKTVFLDEEVDMLFAYTPVVQTPYSDANDKVVHDHLVFDDLAGYSVEKNDDSHLASSSVFYSYFTGTWFTYVTSEPTGFSASAIDTPEELAWVISLVNGRTVEDGGTPTAATAATDITLIADIDMGAHIWVPIGSDASHPYSGTFNGNGHVVTGLQSPLLRDDMGMFGVLTNATITGMVTQVEFRDGPMENVGAIAGTMTGTTVISNCEGGGMLKGSSGTDNIGGLVGKVTGGTIHSSFAVTDITAFDDNTFVGGLAGTNGGNLYNSYSNVTMYGGKQGGLVGNNTGTVENCYSTKTTNAFAHTNSGSINYCYAPNTNYYNTNTGTLTGHGTYGVVVDRKDKDYLYRDNTVSATNDYVVSAISYANGHINKWPGMLSALNNWVNQDASHIAAYTPWLRPTTQTINGDLPVLVFSTSNSLATLDSDGKFLEYGAFDDLLEDFNNADEAASMFLYGNATGVTNVPDPEVFVYINEDACLLQASGSKDFNNTTVGITFDNSDHGQNAQAFDGTTLYYDWHLMSTPLSNAPIGIAYKDYETHDEEAYSSGIDFKNMSENYFPNFMPQELGATANSDWNWDFYCYYEPEYHWINLKRNKKNHFHFEIDRDPGNTGVFQTDASGHKHYKINYTGDDQADSNIGGEDCIFIPGKGYMMAIQKDAYMCSTGTLNKGDVTIPVTHTVQDPNWDDYFSQGCNLIGNPYQAYLDLEEVAKPTGEGGTGYTKFFIYDADQNAYAPYVKESSENPVIPSQYIHPHQAFFVQKADVGTESITLKPAMTTTTSTGSYYRGGKVNYPLVNLFVENEQGAKNYTIVEVGRPELGGAEKSDALKTTNFDFYAHYGEQNYKLLFTPAEAQRVPVFFHTEEDGNFTITWDTYHGPFRYLRLIDNIAGTECDMLANDHYSFYGQATDYAARFYLVFDNPSEDPQDPSNANHPFAFNDGNNWIVSGSGQLELIDVMGRVLLSEHLTGEISRVNLDRFAKGTYLFRLIKDKNDVKTQKIVLY